jgi:hypothetical protein
MKKVMFTLLVLVVAYTLHAQQIVELKENTPIQNNGFEYGFMVTNETSKEVKGEDLDRYEVNLFVINKSGGFKLIPFQNSPDLNEDERAVAIFNCVNATGKRLTSKGGKVQAKPLYMQVKVNDGSPYKYKYTNAQVGYGIKNGQTLSSTIIVLVPKGERPKITCSTQYLPEM